MSYYTPAASACILALPILRNGSTTAPIPFGRSGASISKPNPKRLASPKSRSRRRLKISSKHSGGH